MGKRPRSFSIDDELAEMLSQRDDLNPSGAVNTFLREYLSGGRGAEAALEVRISQLDEEIGELEQELTRKKRERERLESRVRDRRAERDDVITEAVERIENDLFPRENLVPENEAVQTWAADAGIDSEQFVDEVEPRL